MAGPERVVSRRGPALCWWRRHEEGGHLGRELRRELLEEGVEDVHVSPPSMVVAAPPAR